MFVNLIEIVLRDNLNLNATGYYKLHFQADFSRFPSNMINEHTHTHTKLEQSAMVMGYEMQNWHLPSEMAESNVTSSGWVFEARAPNGGPR